MAVSSSKPQLEEAWIAVQFQIAGLTAAFEGDIPEAVYHVRDDAYSAICGEYRGLSSMYQGEGTVEEPVYDICENDEDVLEHRGRLVVGVSFVSGADFTDEAIAELKTLCVEKFIEAAAAHAVSCVFAGIDGWRRLIVVEQTTIEAA